ncbi:IPTL-CTERM sorting domain-containing protein [Chiayiivirga flava]|uniref:Adhesin HecA-like repeat protein n=1 Tax=Chiayiivirga flava TaxID=659595 RepID=A0A7W8D8U2_9GAMM|nr:IPTL-CTERM sorting domain-containing protein [Chiayiivirga flava]MBB5208907.1 adhesin HecA-like repeat protein [Chiayiivirga flava]
MRYPLIGSVLLLCLAAIAPASASITVPAGATLDLRGGRIDAAGGDVVTSGTVRLGAGELLGVGDFRVLAGTADLGSGAITLVGDWENRATVIAGSSVVEFRDGPAAIRAILGSTQFATLSLVSANGTRYRLESGSTQRVSALLEIVGEGVPIQIDVTAAGIAAVNLLPGGTQDIANVGVSNVHATGQPLAPTLTNQGGSGNATGWFGGGGGGPTDPPVVVQPLVVPALSDLGLLLMVLLFGAVTWRQRRHLPSRLRA